MEATLTISLCGKQQGKEEETLPLGFSFRRDPACLVFYGCL